MKFTRIKLSILLLLFSSTAYSQTIKGTVKDQATQGVLPYATISVVDKNIRTLSQRDGSFELKSIELVSTDSLMVSYIGYEPAYFSLKDIDANSPLEVYLLPGATSLAPVDILSIPREVGKLGYVKAGRKMTGWGDFESGRGRTRGVLLSDIECSSAVKSFNFRINHNDWDSVSFRLNFLSVDDGVPGESILKEDIIFQTSQKHRWVNIDLMDYNIQLCGDVFVVLEWVDAWGTLREYSNLLTLSLSKEEGYAYSREHDENVATVSVKENVPAMYIEVFAK